MSKLLVWRCLEPRVWGTQKHIWLQVSKSPTRKRPPKLRIQAAAVLFQKLFSYSNHPFRCIVDSKTLNDLSMLFFFKSTSCQAAVRCSSLASEASASLGSPSKPMSREVRKIDENWKVFVKQHDRLPSFVSSIYPIVYKLASSHWVSCLNTTVEIFHKSGSGNQAHSATKQHARPFLLLDSTNRVGNCSTLTGRPVWIFWGTVDLFKLGARTISANCFAVVFAWLHCETSSVACLKHNANSAVWVRLSAGKHSQNQYGRIVWFTLFWRFAQNQHICWCFSLTHLAKEKHGKTMKYVCYALHDATKGPCQSFSHVWPNKNVSLGDSIHQTSKKTRDMQKIKRINQHWLVFLVLQHGQLLDCSLQLYHDWLAWNSSKSFGVSSCGPQLVKPAFGTRCWAARPWHVFPLCKRSKHDLRF